MNDRPTDSCVCPELSTHTRVLIPVEWPDDDNVEVRREKWKTIIDLESVGKEVNDMTLILVLDAANLANFNEAINARD